jgi:hypothetical protein
MGKKFHIVCRFPQQLRIILQGRKFGGCCGKYLELGGLKNLTSTEDYIKKSFICFSSPNEVGAIKQK